MAVPPDSAIACRQTTAKFMAIAHSGRGLGTTVQMLKNVCRDDDDATDLIIRRCGTRPISILMCLLDTSSAQLGPPETVPYEWLTETPDAGTEDHRNAARKPQRALIRPPPPRPEMVIPTVDNRLIILFGPLLSAVSMWQMTQFLP
jgi:hypothetical protein